MRLAHWIILLGASLLLPGCYTYAPVRVESVPVGASVRAHLSDEAYTALRDSVGAAERALVGQVLERDRGSLLLQVPWALAPNLPPSEIVHQRLRFRESDLLSIELRRLDRMRTGVMAAGLGMIALYAVQQIFEGEAGSKGAEAEPASPEAYRGPAPHRW